MVNWVRSRFQETQGLGLAQTMVLELEVLFLDEPTASIDPQNTAVIEEIILTQTGGPVPGDPVQP
ncbi:MAG TPA: hypothetical protein VLR91_04080 [Thermodesulfobacteriota bacterium]|nr:hypothetical protein [Thermodesulfobacteriota bacterium]